jgi:potassium/chloride transporter 4/5/6
VVTVCNLVIGDLLNDELDLAGRRNRIQSVIDAEDIVVFPEVDAVNDVVEGIVNVSQANGMAGMSSNTVLLGWPEENNLRAEFLRVMRRLERLNKSFVLGRIRPKYMFRRENPKIHVWWGGLERNGDLMLLLAHLLHSNPEWRGATVEVLSLASSELMRTRTETYLTKLLPEIRIEAEVRVVLKPKDQTVTELIHRESAEAAAVFLGLEVPAIGDEEAYAERMDRLAGDLPVVFFVKNSSLFVGELLDAAEAVVKEEATGANEADDHPSRDALPLPE